MDLDQRLRLIIDLVGAEKAFKGLEKTQKGIANLQKQQGLIAFSGIKKRLEDESKIRVKAERAAQKSFEASQSFMNKKSQTAFNDIKNRLQKEQKIKSDTFKKQESLRLKEYRTIQRNYQNTQKIQGGNSFSGIKARLIEEQRLIKQTSKIEEQALIKKQKLKSQSDKLTAKRFDYQRAEQKRQTQEELKGIKARLTANVKAENDKNKAVEKEAKRFKGEYMSIMFGGMALQRAFGGLFKSMIADYKEFTKESVTPLGESLTRLEANWKFLKFAMVDAASGLLGWIADGLASMAKSMSKMNPTVLAGLVGVIGGLGALGGAMVAIGQGVLFWEGLSFILKIGKFKDLNKVMGGLNSLDNTSLKSGTDFFKSMKNAAGLALATYGTFKFVKELTDKEETSFGDILTAAISTGLGTALLFNPATGIITGLTIAAVMTVDAAKEKLGKAGTALNQALLDAKGVTSQDPEKMLQAILDLETGIALTRIDNKGVRGLFTTVSEESKILRDELAAVTLEYAYGEIGLDSYKSSLEAISGLDFPDKLRDVQNINVELTETMKTLIGEENKSGFSGVNSQITTMNDSLEEAQLKIDEMTSKTHHIKFVVDGLSGVARYISSINPFSAD